MAEGSVGVSSGSVEYWKARALTAEQDFHELQQQLKKERKERKEYENLLIQKFDEFCLKYEEKLMNEMMKYNNYPSNSMNRSLLNEHGNGGPTLQSSSSSGGGGGGSENAPPHEIIIKRSNTPRRAAPIPPNKRSLQN